MKWITRERPKIDRIACPWLIKRFVDQDAMYMHIGGMGPEEKLAQGVKAVLEKVKEVRGMNTADGTKTG